MTTRFLLLMFSLFTALNTNADVFKVGRAIPDVELVKAGEIVKLKDQVKGKTMVHVFASW